MVLKRVFQILIQENAMSITTLNNTVLFKLRSDIKTEIRLSIKLK